MKPKKIIGNTVGTPTSPKKMGEILRPVTSINGEKPDENGNVNLRQLPPEGKPGQVLTLTEYGCAWMDDEHNPHYIASDEPPEDTSVLFIDTSEPDEAVALGVTAEETAEGVNLYCTDELGTTRVTVRHGEAGAPGAPGEKGEKGDPGEKYEPTQEDLEEIAGMAAGMVQLPGGGGEEWELLWEKTFSEDDLGVTSWLFTPNTPATEIVIVAQNLRSNQTLGWLLKVNDLPIMPHRPYLNTDGTKYQQLYCKLMGNIWQVQCAESSSKNLGFVSFFTVSGDLNPVGKAETVEFGQSAIQDYQVYGGSVRIYAR